jgi:Ni/Co efflux regulator RcnB
MKSFMTGLLLVGALAAALTAAGGAAAEPHGGYGQGRGGYGQGYGRGGGAHRGGFEGGPPPLRYPDTPYGRPGPYRGPGPGFYAGRGPYAPPPPARSRGFTRGQFLPPEYAGAAVADPRLYHLRRPPDGYGWIVVGPNAYLTQRATGLILDTAPLY